MTDKHICPTCHSNTTGRVYHCKRKDCFWRTSGRKLGPTEKVHKLADDAIASQKRGKKS